MQHAKRLFPLKVNKKNQLEWGYGGNDDGDWTVVDKSVLDEKDVSPGIEKMIGFEGIADPGTGFYCVYNEGRLVNSEAEVRPSSKKLK